MTVRTAPLLLAAALASLAAPALAQDGDALSVADLEGSADSAADTADGAGDALAADDAGSGTGDALAIDEDVLEAEGEPTAARAIGVGAAAAAVYSPEQAAWLDQCRGAYTAAGGAAAAAAGDCAAQLAQQERAAAGAPGAYAPVRWVRVPIVRDEAAAGALDAAE